MKYDESRKMALLPMLLSVRASEAQSHPGVACASPSTVNFCTELMGFILCNDREIRDRDTR